MDTGFKNPTANGDDYTQWANAANAYASDNTYATEITNGQQHDFYNFAFGLPSGATIDGIEAVLEAKVSGTLFAPRDIQVELSYDGGANYTSSSKTTGNLTTSDVNYTLGGAADTWGRSWSDTDFSDANFRIRVTWNNSVWGYTVSLDNIKVKVYYTSGAVNVAVDTKSIQVVGIDATVSAIYGLTSKAAFFRGNQLDGGATDFDVATATLIDWNLEQTYNSDVFSYNAGASTNTRIVVKEAGDYLVCLNIPLQRTDANTSSRTRIEAQLFKNGTKLDLGIGRASYIRNNSTGAAGHRESSNAINVLVEGLIINDYIEVKILNITTVDAGDTVLVYESYSCYIEKVENTETVFSATATQAGGSTTMNPATAAEVDWLESRKDAGYTHSDGGGSPQDITLDAAGEYLITVNIPLSGAAQRANVRAEILLDGVLVVGGIFAQGYIRNAESDTESSIHWIGIVKSTSASQVLTVSVIREDATVSTVVTTGSEKATLMAWKLPSTRVFYSEATQLDGGLTDWSQASKTAIDWENDVIIDTAVFTHSTTVNQHQITVDEDGDYLLFFNGAWESTAAQRINPRITVEVDGAEINGAVGTSAYQRYAGSAEESSTTIVYLLKGLSATSIITISTQDEATAGVSNDLTAAVVGIWKKEAGGTAYTQALSEILTVVDVKAMGPAKPLAETITLTDSITRQIATTLTEALALVDSIAFQMTRVLSEVVKLVDTKILSPAKTLVETITLVDAISKIGTFFKSLGETVTLNDGVIKDFVMSALNETITLTDTIATLFGKVLKETITLVDDLFMGATKVLTETIVIVDNLARSAQKSLKDVITLTDTLIARITAKTLKETVVVADTISKQAQKVLSEVINLTDTVVRQITRTFTEVIGLTDTIIKGVTRIFTEVVTLTDSRVLRSGKNFLETITLTDAFSQIGTFFKSLAETITLSDSVIKDTVISSLKEVITLTDTLVAKITGKLLSETITLVDSISSVFGKVFSEVVTLADTFSRIGTYIKSFTEKITITDVLATVFRGLADLGKVILTTVADRTIVGLKTIGRTLLKTSNVDRSVIQLKSKDKHILKTKRKDKTTL